MRPRHDYGDPLLGLVPVYVYPAGIHVLEAPFKAGIGKRIFKIFHEGGGHLVVRDDRFVIYLCLHHASFVLGRMPTPPLLKTGPSPIGAKSVVTNAIKIATP